MRVFLQRSKILISRLCKVEAPLSNEGIVQSIQVQFQIQLKRKIKPLLALFIL